jgi:NADPH:quinone reductase-like Zn-dependent oxidoreductase
MKAIRIHEFGAPEVMQLEEVPDPQAGPGEVVVREVKRVSDLPYLRSSRA